MHASGIPRPVGALGFAITMPAQPPAARAASASASMRIPSSTGCSSHAMA
jgi:hypothetical protein